MTPREWGMLLALSVLWGGSFFFTAVALKELPPFTLVALRLALAALALNLAIRAMNVLMPRDRTVWAAFFGMGVLNNAVPFSLIVYGQTQIASGLASILNATTPLATVIVAHLLTPDEKMTGNKLAGVIVGFLGVAAMIGPEALRGLGADVLAQLACVAAAIFYAFSGVYGRRFKPMGVSPMQTAAGQLTASTLMLIPVALVVDRPWTLASPSLPAWGAVVGIAMLSTALAYVLFFRILAAAGATNLLLVTFLIPVSAVLLGTLVLGERLHAKHLVGMGLIGAGLATIDGRLLATVRKRMGLTPAESVRKSTGR